MTKDEFFHEMNIAYAAFNEKVRHSSTPFPTVKEAFEKGFQAAGRKITNDIPTEGTFEVDVTYERKPSTDDIIGAFSRIRDALPITGSNLMVYDVRWTGETQEEEP